VTDPIAIILAGGASSRMGVDKAEYPIGGRPMIEWVIEAATSALGTVVVVGRQTAVSGVESIPDAGGEHRGPLSGIVTALRAFGAPLVALAVDQPLVRAGTIEAVAGYGDPRVPAVPIDEGREQVTCARYPLEWLDLAETELDANGNLRNLLRTSDWTRIQEATWRSWGEDGQSWFSIDQPADVVVAEQRFRLNLH